MEVQKWADSAWNPSRNTLEGLMLGATVLVVSFISGKLRGVWRVRSGAHVVQQRGENHCDKSTVVFVERWGAYRKVRLEGGLIS